MGRPAGRVGHCRPGRTRRNPNLARQRLLHTVRADTIRPSRGRVRSRLFWLQLTPPKPEHPRIPFRTRETAPKRQHHVSRMLAYARGALFTGGAASGHAIGGRQQRPSLQGSGRTAVCAASPGRAKMPSPKPPRAFPEEEVCGRAPFPGKGRFLRGGFCVHCGFGLGGLSTKTSLEHEQRRPWVLSVGERGCA